MALLPMQQNQMPSISIHPRQNHVVYFSKGLKNPILILNNHEFWVHIKKQMGTRWRCGMFVRTKCKAALFTSGKIVGLLSENHNHRPPIKKRNNDHLVRQNVTIIRDINLL
ncbi:hypothetical protein TcasGA2_TC011444 [Tribolium castaneum]|uniref:FLYWCH-type domain-containing protein n=1 Tax=Tribolium castaneum TaxID=7070 RepID=D6X4N4_TRICA|nr:hypothetical protein TcasGA2_TC011444 [Tribolium castaneum]